jgi:tetratricopeptide (TPR) repeat protein
MKYTWLVEKYLEGELSGEALRRFELEILKKPEVAEEVERIRSLQRFMEEQHDRMDIRSGLIEDYEDLENVMDEDQIGRELEGLKIRKISSRQEELAEFKTKISETQIRDKLRMHRSRKILVKKASIWLAASALILITAVSLLLLTGRNDADYEKLYAQFYSPPPADLVRSSDQPDADPYNQGMQAYRNGDYVKAFRLFYSIPGEGVINRLYLYRGITAMELGKYPVAIEQFNKLESDPILQHEGMWYKSLCYLGMEDIKAARNALNEIIRADGYYRDMAASLLRKL